MPHASTRLLLSVLMLCGCGSAAAQDSGKGRNQYRWHDASGSLHYSDALPPEAAKFGYDVVGPQGIVIKHVERAKTADELAAAKAAQAKDQAERDAAERVARSDAQLLASYPAEADLRRTQQQQLEMLNQQVNAAEISLRSQEQTLADMLARAADAERTGKTLPEVQAKQLAAMRKQVDDQRLAVARRESERNQANQRFESDAAHYRDLRAKADARGQ